jgi:hypothetical protein
MASVKRKALYAATPGAALLGVLINTRGLRDLIVLDIGRNPRSVAGSTIWYAGYQGECRQAGDDTRAACAKANCQGSRQGTDHLKLKEADSRVRGR